MKLVEAGAELNILDNFKMTPLHFACMMGNQQLVDLLMRRGVNQQVLDMYNKTPLEVARFNEQTELIQYLSTNKFSIMVDVSLLLTMLNINPIFVRSFFTNDKAFAANKLSCKNIYYIFMNKLKPDQIGECFCNVV